MSRHVLITALFAAFVLGSFPIAAQDGGALQSLSRAVAGEARRASSSNEDIERNGDARPIEAGATLVLMEEEGPGEVTHFWNTVGTTDIFHGRSLVLRVYYDGLEKPSVEAPLGDFFGVGHGAFKDFTSMPVTVSSTGRSRTCYWRMPFRKSIKITVSNDSPDTRVDSFYYYLNWRKLDSLPGDALYFHARYRQEHPPKAGERYLILDTEGEGHYAGTVLSAFQLDTGWFGEGDDFFFIDGAETPQLWGTGTEDYFCDAWGFREFCSPFHGVTLYEGVLTGDRVTAYRWHVEDPIPFSKSLRLEIEHKGSVFDDQNILGSMNLGGFVDRADWFSSVAFWYQRTPAQFEGGVPPHAERIPPHKIIMATEMMFRADPPMLIIPQGPLVLYGPNQPEASIEFDFHLAEDGRYRLDGVFVFGLMFGAYQPYLDGEKLGAPINFYIPNYDPRWVNLDIHDLKAGTHTLKFVSVPSEVREMRALAPKYNCIGLGALTILRLDDMEGYKHALTRALAK